MLFQYNKILDNSYLIQTEEANFIKEKLQNNHKVDDVVLSLIHMFLNRLLSSNHRKQEMILYYFLFKTYKSLKARIKYDKN